MSSTYHSGKWFKDIATKKSKLKLRNETKVKLKYPEERYEVFDKDCCLLFEKKIYAEGQGLEIDDEILNIFKEHPNLSPRADSITSQYYIYGKVEKSNKAIGLQGKGLKFKGVLGEKLLNCILIKIHNKENATPPFR